MQRSDLRINQRCNKFRSGCGRMSIAACLLLYGFTVAILAPQLLVRLGSGRTPPRFALITWVSAMVSVAVAWLSAIVVLIIDVICDLGDPSHPSVVDSCLSELHDAGAGHYGPVVQAGLLALTGFAVVSAGVAIVRLARTLRKGRNATRDHAQMVRLAGRHDAELDVVVLALDEPAAYCVAGRLPTVVVTEAVIAALDDDQLAAVLAHERAHLAGRHHVLLAVTRGLATVFARFRIFTVGATEVAALLEMCADDQAVRVHGPDAVIGALFALTDATAKPAGALSVARTGLSARIARLTAIAGSPRRVQQGWTRLTIEAALVTAGPLLATVVAVIGIAVCAPALT